MHLQMRISPHRKTYEFGKPPDGQLRMLAKGTFLGISHR